uniref:uncharacterized protein C12orf81-like n=1 Tax=Podarcis muralis TaxID=64176 RepID=UPI0010A090F0|nr:uncharacterized protein C12orf81-like [Podarcis muralis]
MLILIGTALFLLVHPALPDDTVADDIGSHMMGRISELLSPEECQAFYAKLIGPEENVNEELQRLSAERNPIRRRREIATTEACKATLNGWLETEGDAMYWDRLSRALQAVGRPDVSLELGKNLNQDKSLEIKKNVEGYHKTVQRLTSSLLLEENEMGGSEGPGGRLRREGSQAQLEEGDWDKLELIIERRPLPPYNRSIFQWVTPLVTGVVGGFLTSFVVVALAVYSFFWILKQESPTPMMPNWDSVPDMIFRSPSPKRGAIYYSFQQFDDLGKRGGETEDYGDDDDNEEDWEKEPIVRS